MIPRVHRRGTNVGGLLRYLYGPGRCQEHLYPHLVAAWDGAGPLPALEPQALPGGRVDFRPLVALLTDPVRAGWSPPASPVWHCSVRLAPQDRVLSDGQWAHISREIMAGAGLAPHGDVDAVRWVAVRHAADHVHLVATLVRQDGRTEAAFRDFVRTRAAARDLEVRYGLRSTGPA
ncbi:MAG: relaxase, partial [Pseudonocardia sp.]|nr:relaxase [Pseudonocardia sp.]